MTTVRARSLTRVVKLLRSVGIAATASALMALAPGCASEASDSSANDQSAISSDDAAKGLPTAHKTLSDLPSGVEAAKLGVVSWDVFTFLNQDFDKNGADKFNGVASFGMNKDGDVAYVVILESTGLKVAKLSADGTPSIADLTGAKVVALMADVATFAAKLPATQGGLRTQTATTNGADCSVSTAKLLLGGVVLAAGGVLIIGGVVVGGIGAVGVAGFVGATGEIGVAALGTMLNGMMLAAGAGVGAGGYAIVTASWPLRVLRDGLNCRDLGASK